MKTETTIMTTLVKYSDDKEHRFSLKKVWDDKLDKMAILMLAPSSASGVEVDHTTMYILTNAVRLGYGSVEIVNLNSVVGDADLKSAAMVGEDPENLEAILTAAKEADALVYAPGLGKKWDKRFQARQEDVLKALEKAGYSSKLVCLSDGVGKKFYHPLAPQVRFWELSPFDMKELVSEKKEAKSVAKTAKSAQKPKEKVVKLPVTAKDAESQSIHANPDVGADDEINNS